MSAEVLVSIVAACRNEVDFIEKFVASIYAQKLPAKYKLEVLIADGMSDDGTRDLFEKLSKQHNGLRFIDNPKQITPCALNLAIKTSTAEIIIRMDVHSKYANNYIEECLLVKEETSAENVGGAARTIGEGYIQKANSLTFHSAFSTGGASFHNEDYEGEVDTVIYGCFSRKIFEEIGYFDEDLVRNQDDELNYRIIKNGGRVWQSPRIHSWLTMRSSLKALFRQYYQYGYYKTLILKKYKSLASIRQYIPSVFVLSHIFLLLLSLLTPYALYLWALELMLYGTCSLIFSFRLAAKGGFKFLPILPIVFLTYHIAYGWGFLMGFLDVFLLKRKGGSMATVYSKK